MTSDKIIPTRDPLEKKRKLLREEKERKEIKRKRKKKEQERRGKSLKRRCIPIRSIANTVRSGKCWIVYWIQRGSRSEDRKVYRVLEVVRVKVAVDLGTSLITLTEGFYSGVESERKSYEDER